MSEATADPMPLSAMTAGRLLREARQAQGLHIAALASAIKVAPRKLELLEADRFDELPDATFTRALAQTVCRSLKVDAAPVLALLPRPSGNRLGQVSEGLNTPFRERPGRLVPSDWTSLGRRPGVWGPALVLLTAAAVYFMPSGLFQNSATRVRPPVDSAASAAALATPVVRAGSAAEPTAVAASSVPAVVFEAALPLPAPAPLAAPADAPPKLLQLHAVAGSWIEVVDGRGRALLSRLINPGENVELDGAVPLKVKIGNAAGTEVIFRGQVLELAPFTRDNMARLELK